MATNTTNIATNTSGVASNLGSISTNSSNISTNAIGISNNSAAITSNDTDIANNTSSIAANTAAIAGQDSNLNTLSTELNTAISGLDSNQETLFTDVATNTTNIATNTSGVAANLSSISTNSSNISTNSSNISTGLARINSIESNLETLTTELGSPTASNTANEIVERDSSGDFAANDITANTFIGNLRVPTGAQEGYVLTSDAQGNASWQSLGSAANTIDYYSVTGDEEEELENNSSYQNVPGMQINSVQLTTGDVIKVTFTGEYEIDSDNHHGRSTIRYTFNGTHFGPTQSMRALRRQTTNFGAPFIAMLRCGNGNGEIPPGTYTVRLQGIADNGAGNTDLIFGPGDEYYAMYIEVINN